MVYAPASLVGTGVATSVAVLMAVTVAPATRAPDESVTVPDTLASVCAKRTEAKATALKNQAAHNFLFILFINILPRYCCV